jgi:predicted CoA-binding protein
LQDSRNVVPINPKESEIEGLQAYARLSDVCDPIHGLSIVTPPRITESIIEQAGELDIKHVWIQPGAESNAAIQRASELGMNVIAGGPCLLVELGFRE